MTLVYLVLALVALGVAFVLGRKTAPAPEQKSFGLDAAERMSAELGGLDNAQGKIARVVAAIGGLKWTLVEELKAVRASLAAAKAAGLAKVADYRSKIRVTEQRIAETEARDAQVAQVGKAFDA